MEETFTRQCLQDLVTFIFFFAAIYANHSTTATRFITHENSRLQEKLLT